MRVLFVTPECAPLAKAGGLGDVSAALPAALRELGHEVDILLPAYSEAVGRLFGPTEHSRFTELGFDVRVLR
ncbi:MAG TPA: glycogen/starch synthase, partial [Burkholderiales bacterium]|nr:glycogen/starch synthase [Burkholderiales bacterium]